MSIFHGELLAGVSGIIKTMHTGLSAYTYCIYANAPVLTRKKPDVMIYSVERFV